MRKQLKFLKIFVLGIFILGAFFNYENSAQAIVTCSADINFGPTVQGTTLTLKGTVTVKNIRPNGECIPPFNVDTFKIDFSDNKSVQISFNLNGHPQSPIGQPIVKQLPPPASGQQNPYDAPPISFETQIPSAQAGQPVNGKLSIQACVGANTGQMRCSAVTDVELGASPGGAGGGTTYNCTGANPDPVHCLFNPLPPSADLRESFVAIMTRAFFGVMGLWAVAFIVFGSFKLVVSQGNEEAVLSAKKTITWAIAGFIIATLAFSVIAIVQNFIGANVKSVNVNTPPTSQH